jgi:hypothetical protein
VTLEFLVGLDGKPEPRTLRVALNAGLGDLTNPFAVDFG